MPPHIDTNVPIPERFLPTTQWGDLAIAMKIGDSVLVPNKAQATAVAHALRRIYLNPVESGDHLAAAEAPVATQRKVEGGIRVWRIA